MWIAGAMLALLTAYQVGRMKEDYEDTIEDFEKDKEASKRVIETEGVEEVKRAGNRRSPLGQRNVVSCRHAGLPIPGG